jgi:hypothetical protein
VKAVVLEPTGRQTFRRRLAGAAKRARRAEAHIIQENDLKRWARPWRAQLLDGRIFRIRILRVISHQTDVLPIGNGKNRTAMLSVCVANNFLLWLFNFSFRLW